jgi:WD40 repeat protein
MVRSLVAHRRWLCIITGCLFLTPSCSDGQHDSSDPLRTATFDGQGHRAFYFTFCNSGDMIAAGSSADRFVALWKWRSSTAPQALSGNGDRTCDIETNRNDSMLAICSWDHTLNLWKLPSGKFYKSIATGSNSPREARFLRDGKTVITSEDTKPTGAVIRRWQIDSEQNESLLTLPTETGVSFAVSPDDKTILLTTRQGVEIRDLNKPDLLRKLLAHPRDIATWLATTPEFTKAATCNGNTIKIWDLQRYQELSEFAPDAAGNQRFCGVAYCPVDDTLLAAVVFIGDTEGSQVSLWDTGSHRKVVDLITTQAGFNQIGFSPDGYSLAAADSNGKIHVWNVRSFVHDGKNKGSTKAGGSH